MAASMQRKTADAVVEAFNRMDNEAIISFRSPDCIRYILPSSLGLKPTNNEQYKSQLDMLRPIFRNFSLAVNDVVEDEKARRICMWLSARADTAAGEYVNEYMWTLSFDDSGTKITKVNEFVDTVVNRDFWPKLRDAMLAHQANQQSEK
ncbi:hypothetical protein LTR85_011547 [Meristemomyces frigidus]|nr:hypothetical protein LTR85_011547 [Meristemomyces frigidus]